MASTRSATTPVFPPGRYGRRRDPVRRRRRRLATGLVALVVGLAGVAIAVKLYTQYNEVPYEVSDVQTTAITDTSVTVSFTLTLPAGSGASCTVIAQTHDGAQIATEEFAVTGAADGGTTVQVTHTLTTSKRAFAGSVPGCGPPR